MSSWTYRCRLTPISVRVPSSSSASVAPLGQVGEELAVGVSTARQLLTCGELRWLQIVEGLILRNVASHAKFLYGL